MSLHNNPLPKISYSTCLPVLDVYQILSKHFSPSNNPYTVKHLILGGKLIHKCTLSEHAAPSTISTF
jgi:hypothetical protein